MTNLVEKLLITGLGILMLISLLMIINPFIEVFTEYYNYEEKYDKIILNINSIDSSIQFSINNKQNYSKEVFIFYDINISVEEFQIRYSFSILEKDSLIYTYNNYLKKGDFNLKNQKTYFCNIYSFKNLTKIEFQLKK